MNSRPALAVGCKKFLEIYFDTLKSQLAFEFLLFYGIKNKSGRNMEYQKIWKKILNPDEQVKYEFSVGKKYRVFLMILGCLGGLVLFSTPGYYVGILVITISVFYFWFYLKWANAYAFTNKRIVAYRGWLSTELLSIDYDKITDVVVEEPILDKLFTHTGHLVINTAGAGFQELKQNQKLEHIENPYEIKKKLDEIRSSLIKN